MTHARSNDTYIVAVVVTYQPDLVALGQQLDVLVAQVGAVVIVDNQSGIDFRQWLAQCGWPGVAVVTMDCNLGIGKAQNEGIAWARARAATHVLLMDQDSRPAADMVAQLLHACQSSVQVAAVGPSYQDDRRDAGTLPFVRLKGWRIGRVVPEPGQSIAQVDCLISSGCLIPMKTLNTTGPMREDYFIDYVDTEWCLRASSHGLLCYGVFNAHMAHNLGESPRRFLGRLMPVHSPLRHYYQMRNAILLYRESWVPVRWRLVDGWQRVMKLVFYSLVFPPRWQHLRMMLLGVWHGVRGRAGPL